MEDADTTAFPFLDLVGAGQKVLARKLRALEMNGEREILGREAQRRPKLLIPGGRQHDLDLGAVHDPARLDRERPTPFPAVSRDMDRPTPSRRLRP